MPRRSDAVITPNTRLDAARRRLPSPIRPGQSLSRAELAAAVNAVLDQLYPGRDLTAQYVDARWVGKLERGEHRWPSPERRAALRRVLGVASDEALGLYSPRRIGLAAPGDELGESRRDLLRGIAAVAAASGLLGGSLITRRRLGNTDIDRLGAVLTLYRSMDYEVGGGALVDDLGRFAAGVTALLEQPYSEAIAPKLFTAVAGVHQLAGWTAFDAGLHSGALRHFGTAEQVAVAGGDRLLTARVRYCQARQLQHLHRNRQAVNLLALAIDGIGTTEAPAVAAMLLGAQAASYAALGDKRAALATLGHARDAFEHRQPDDEPDWMRFYDHGELLAQYGRVYRDLARLDPRYGRDAVDRAGEAIAAFGPQNVRSTVLNEVGLTSALFLAREPEQAMVVGRHVLQHAAQLTSRRVIDRIANLRRDIGSHHQTPSVAAFVAALPSRRETRT